MATENDEVERPSIWEALFGNDHVANLRCGAKYAAWIIGYLFLSVIVIGAVILHGTYTYAKRVLFAVGRVLPTGTVGNAAYRVGKPVGQRVEYGGRRVLDGFAWVVTHRHVENAYVVCAAAFLAVFGVVSVSYLIYMAITHPMIFFSAIGVIVTIGLMTIGWIYVLGGEDVEGMGGAEAVKETASTATSKAKETPGVRRVYGHCPVRFDIEPVFFEKLMSIIEE